jgi:hypothetical protein
MTGAASSVETLGLMGPAPRATIRIEMALPQELIDAVTVALDREALEVDIAKRAHLLAATRRTVDGWLRGRITTPQAVALLLRHTAPLA